MGIILTGFLASALVVGLIFAYIYRSNKPDPNIATPLVIIAVVCVIGGFFIGIAEPVSGYGKPHVFSTTELVSLKSDTISEGTGGLYYLSISGTNSYTYYVEVDSAYASKSYSLNTISDSNVSIVEDDNCTDAKLVTYVRYGKKSFWTFAVGAKQYDYVFYVPTGTIAREVKE